MDTLTPDLLDLVARARAWADDDPDETTRRELAELAAAVEAGDEAAATELADRFRGPLEFGTAGLRGRIGAGETRMNRAVVIRAAAGLTAWLQERGGEGGTPVPSPTVVVGYDARHGSHQFALDTAAVVVGAGGQAIVLPEPLPTPVLAYAIRHTGADAGVMVTASHNPPQDNGYKVYLGDGSQIVPPVDAEIASHIAAVESVASVPRAEEGWITAADDVREAYVETAAQVVDPAGPKQVSVVHTALHGVGGDVLVEAFEAAGFPTPKAVVSQAAPDPDFPTVAFPNPEEEGAIDEALALAARVQPDVVLANDPDADRCAVAVPDPTAVTPDDPAGWRMLRGDEVGALLGHHLIRRAQEAGGLPQDAVMATSIVSSRLLGRIAAAAGVGHLETLTGFKWIGRVPGLFFGYEEALGYCVDPRSVKDKDGITAALAVADAVARLRQGSRTRTVLDVLDDLYLEHGVHATDSFSIRVDDLERIGQIMGALRAEPPSSLGGQEVTESVDLAEGWGELPPTDGLRWLLADDTRVIVRPSGTEPKVKVYLEVVVPVQGTDLIAAKGEASSRLAAVRADMERLTA
ncbi:phosphomannomutase [Kytococcus aerolatus]|uniref:Phosphomannomutase n=1 Tax=Kytococcus aerolatus TaxID=592308 RepID=A0A212TZF8_9MICO|nr:phospho-sugar mutase [Kytococcus aerolatus]SNC71383.1 phosphomannomutase [Kytococcus aerolatus]